MGIRHFAHQTVILLIITAAAYASAEEDTRSVQADFDRCKSTMERVDRSIQRYKDIIIRLKQLSRTEGDSASRTGASLESRFDHFRGRFDRASGQADKIRDDLKNIKGPSCPSCVSSSVNMYCRNAETLLNDLEEHIAKAADLENRMVDRSTHKDAGNPQERSESLSRRRIAIDSIIGLRKLQLDSCSFPSAKALWLQCRINLHKSDSLIASKDYVAGGKTLDIAELLIRKALDVCGNR